MRATLIAAALLGAACATTSAPDDVKVSRGAATRRVIVPAQPAPPPAPTYVVQSPPPQATVIMPRAPETNVHITKANDGEAARLRLENERNAAALRDAQARASDAERQRDEEAQRSAAAEEKARLEAQARADAEKRAGDLERELALISEVRETERGLVVTLSGDVNFEFDRAVLLPPAHAKLTRLADALKKAELKLAIEGHTDAMGPDQYNQDLSTRRSMAVRDFLLAQGVQADRIQATGYGERQPIADNASPEGRAMNRRVEIIILTHDR